jgi:hypothetical protein
MHAAHNDAPQPKPRFNRAAWDAMPHGVAAQRPPARRHAARLVLCRPAHADAVRSCSVSQVSDEGGGIKREQVVAPRCGFSVPCRAVLCCNTVCVAIRRFVARCPKPRGVIAWEAQRLPLCPRLTCSLQWPQSRPSREPCVRTAASRVPLAVNNIGAPSTEWRYLAGTRGGYSTGSTVRAVGSPQRRAGRPHFLVPVHDGARGRHARLRQRRLARLRHTDASRRSAPLQLRARVASSRCAMHLLQRTLRV